jgi:hypothetical protein
MELKKYELFWIEEPKSFNCEVAHQGWKFSWSWRSMSCFESKNQNPSMWSSARRKKNFIELKNYELFWIEEPKSLNCEVAQRKQKFMELKKYELFWIKEPKSFNCEVAHKGRKISLSWRSMSCFKLKNQNPSVVK